MKKKSISPRKGQTPLAKEKRLFQNILKTLQQFVQGKAFTSMTAEDICQKLQLPPQHQVLCRKALETLVEQNILQFSGNLYRPKKPSAEIISGLLHAHTRGFGFVRPDDPTLYAQDIFIPKQFMHTAVDGDKVEVEVNTDVISEKGPEGKISAILSRSRTHVAGIIQSIEQGGKIYAYVPLLGSSQKVIVQPSEEYALRVGDRLIMQVVNWGAKGSNDRNSNETLCIVTHYLGHISDPSCDIKAAIEEFELNSDFSHNVLQEALSVGSRVSPKDLRGREDLRKLTCFTIDPDTAKDFDDAISLHKDAEGVYHLGVHIADVSHYVRPGTALDAEAAKRCNSTYFPRYCLPMLPKELSDNLCSLKPLVNRLTASVFIDFDPEGNRIQYRISRTIIRSAKRFTYKEAKAVLEGKKRSPYLPHLQLMVELCHLLKRKRYERGSVEFSIPEVVVCVDDKGAPQGTEYIEYDITHQLVEEFMLKANETVAFHLSEQGKNLTYRVHEEPSEENLKDFSLLAAAFGFHLSQKPTPMEIQKLFDEAIETAYGPYLATSYIRRMRLAAYSAENIGHYGLGLTHYCHFTSPIRRYVDLVVHRILFGDQDDRITLERIALQCSDQERISSKAESSVVLLKKLRLLEKSLKQEPRKEYSAIITRVKPFGIFFEIVDLMVEGFLHVSELDDDYYVFKEGSMRLEGVRTHKGFSPGESVNVLLKSVDLIFLETTWEYLREKKQKKRKGPKRGR
jgi:ribonuclease R